MKQGDETVCLREQLHQMEVNFSHALREKDAILLEKESALLEKDTQIKTLEEDKRKMEQELLYLRRKMFGQMSERFMPNDPNQLCLNFSAQEKLKEETPDIKPVLEEIGQETELRRNRQQAQKKRPVRMVLPQELERVERIIEPQIENPGEMVRIGQDVKEVLHYKPGTLWVERIIRPIYKLKIQDKDQINTPIYQASLPEFPLPKSNASADLLAHLLVGKYEDHLPIYRQIEIFKRQGIQLPASTIGGWFENVSLLLEPLYQVMVKEVLDSGYIQVDESTIPVIDHLKGKAAKAYLWVVRAIQRNMVFFHYDSGSRAQRVVISLLRDYKGTIQTDGYEAYSIYENKKDILLLGCWAHARRYFEKALSEDQKRAGIALSYIGKLYEVEANLKESDATQEEIVRKRTRQSLAVIQEFEKWMYSITGDLLPKSLMRKAVDYTFSMLPRLTRYVTNGSYAIDNNPVENAIRPMAIGRKNYLFCGNHQTARDTAMFYTFLGCCKLAKVNSFEWLTYVLQNINDTKVSELHKLFPENWKETFDQ
jgi:transposase